MAQVILFNVTNGLIIGAFYVLMALGLSLILNLSNVINFAHGNFLALGGYLAFTLSPVLGYWGALLISPLLTALIGVVVERLMIRRIYNRDPVYSLLLTFGLALIFQGLFQNFFGASGLPYAIPKQLSGANTQSLCVYVDDAEAHCERARKVGAVIHSEPATVDYGPGYGVDRGYECVDLGGHHWYFVQRIQENAP